MTNYHREFQETLDSIGKLIQTPNLMQTIVLESLESFDISGFSYMQKQKFERVQQSIANISNKSLKDSYNIIYNQLCVLAVSSLSAILEKYFINYANSHWGTVRDPKKIRIGLEQIKEYNFQLKSALGEIILKNDNSIKFQDLQSTLRSFEDYFEKDINLDLETKKHVIFYQQIRHILVHNDGVVNEEFLRKTGSHNLKNYRLNQKAQLDDQDWELIQKYFKYLIKKLIPSIPQK